ncbi:hypothetical protein [Desulfocurvus vexinensis]|uniref:hypothetical protein n=1 Tax=Desulfocurvus vexinensis TaxID=399548 RepID=UPI0004B32297|nr:hypothetical protein [Desulfocurvus vexinensis]
MTSARPALPLLACLLATLLLGACAMEADLANPPVLYVDELVTRAWQPEVFVEPENPPMQPLTAVFFPLRMRPQMANAQPYAEEMSRVFWQAWLRERVFPALAFAQGETWRTPAQAMAVADGSADLIVGGEITHVMFGGSSGTTQVSVRLEVYDAAAGTLLWSMAHAGEMRNAQTRDFIILTKKSRLPAEPVQAIMTALAQDLAVPVKAWNHGQPQEDPAAPSPLD